MNDTPNIHVRKSKINGDLGLIKRTLEHIIHGDKVLPLSDVVILDTTNQIIDFYKQFDGVPDCVSGCSDCSDFIFRCRICTDKSEYKIAMSGNGVSVQSLMGFCGNSKVFDTKSVAEWMYSYALVKELIPQEKIVDVLFPESSFNQFKKRISLN